jgi:hypothetical protein
MGLLEDGEEAAGREVNGKSFTTKDTKGTKEIQMGRAEYTGGSKVEGVISWTYVQFVPLSRSDQVSLFLRVPRVLRGESVLL